MYTVYGVRPFAFILVFGASVAYCQTTGANVVFASSPVLDTHRLSVMVTRGSSFIGIDPVKVSLSVRGEDRDDFSLSVYDDHWSLFADNDVEVEFKRIGADLVAVINVSSGFSFLSVKGGRVAIELSVPLSWWGCFNVSSFSGNLCMSDLRLEECIVEQDRGYIRMERIISDRLTASILDSNGDFCDLSAGDGSLSCRLGQISARRMNGSWDIEGKDRRIVFEAGIDLVRLRIATRLGSVSLSFQALSAFSVTIIVNGLGRVVPALPLETKKGRITQYEYSRGSGGSCVLVETRDGLVTLDSI